MFLVFILATQCCVLYAALTTESAPYDFKGDGTFLKKTKTKHLNCLAGTGKLL